MSIRTKNFWIAATERAVKSVAGAALSVLTVDTTSTVFNVNWETVAGVSLTAGLVSYLMSILSAPVNNDFSPSLTSEK